MPVDALTSHRMTVARYSAASAAFALYSFGLYQTSLATSGMMFIAPMAIFLAVHALWLWRQKREVTDLTKEALRASLKNAGLLLALVFLAEIMMPTPSLAGGSDLTGLLVWLVCAAMVLAVITVVGGFLLLLISVIFSLGKFGRNGKDRTHEMASLALAFTALLTMSLEGVPGAFSFGQDGQAVASRTVSAPPERVWQALDTATAPAFSRPVLTSLLPQPVDVLVDEGVVLGANRVVQFVGRQGAGALRLRVVERSETHVRFEVLEDTSPIALWVAFEALTYRVDPRGSETQLEVSLDYARHLSPAWLFDPMIELAGYLSMDTLARDVRARAMAVPDGA